MWPFVVAVVQSLIRVWLFATPMDCSMPGLPVLHHLPELAQTHVHWISDAIQPSHPLLSPSPSAFNLSQHQGLFQWVSSLHQVAKVLAFQFQHSVQFSHSVESNSLRPHESHTPGLPVHHQFPEFTQTHVHWVKWVLNFVKYFLFLNLLIQWITLVGCERTSFAYLELNLLGHFIGEGDSTPLQYSCLENPMDGGAWWAAVHGVAKSQTRLSDFTFTFMHWRRKWQPTPVFLPGESQGRGSLVGCRLWGRTESDTTEAT